MGHHIDEVSGVFVSDKYPDIGTDRIVVSFRHQEAWPALAALAEAYQHRDPELADDIRERLKTCRAGNRSRIS